MHEFGHFIAGKLMGLKVKEFMFGLPGPNIVSFKWGETRYGITAIPFGGYVKYAGVESELQMEEDEEDKDTPPERKYDTQPRWKKAIIMVAGPAMNMVLPVILISMILMFQGTPEHSNVLGKVEKGSPAAQVGLREGDRVTSIGGKQVSNWSDLVEGLQAKPGEQITVVAERDGQTLMFKPTLDSREGRGFLGVRVNEKHLTYNRLPIHTAIYEGARATVGVISFMAVTLYKVIADEPGRLVSDSAGPVGITAAGARIAEQSIWQYLWLLAVISVNIGIVNLLPIPPLDGGRLAILGIESVKRRPINRKIIYTVNAVGMALLLALMVYFVFIDITRMIAGTPFLGGG